MYGEKRAAAIKAAQDIVEAAKAAAREMTADEIGRVEQYVAEVKGIDATLASMGSIEGLVPPAPVEPEGEKGELPPSIAERFIKSDAFRAFRKAFPAGVGQNTPVSIKAESLGSAADLGIGLKATITTQTGNGATATPIPGYYNTLVDQPLSFLDLVTSGTTASSYIEYRQITAETDGAAVVAEGELKPLSDITTTPAEAKVFTYADGFDITNQTLADDGALAAFMEERIRFHVRRKVEDLLINGAGGATAPLGILNTTGVQQQAFSTDVVGTLAAALGKVEAVGVDPQAIVMNPADIWALRLLRENGATGAYLLGNPLQQGVVPTPFGVPLVKSTRVAAGTALVGRFTSMQFLVREALSVTAFNQHKDYAQRNMAYVRAELRAMQVFYAPREVVVADLTA